MADYIWPLSKSTTPDEMNTSFGPRIDANKWDFHDGIDLPAPIGTPVYAMRQGIVHRAGPGVPKQTPRGIHSRHVILEVNDPSDVVMYLVYLHLHSIAEGIIAGASVAQGQLLGTVGEDDATYPHLHLEFRKGNPAEKSSVHPLAYLPYADTPNFTAPILDRFNRLDTLMAARLCFGASSKLEGDLLCVEVDLVSGATPFETRCVDFNDKKTINGGKGDEKLFAEDDWHKWKLRLLRIGTRETTAVLSLDDREKLWVNWDSTAFEPRTLRAGIGLASAGATSTVLTDELRLTESTI